MPGSPGGPALPIREKPGGPAGPGCPWSPGLPVPGLPGKPGGPGGPRGPGFPGGPGSPFRSIGSSGRGISEKEKERTQSGAWSLGTEDPSTHSPTPAWGALEEDKDLYLFVKTTPRSPLPALTEDGVSGASSGNLGGLRVSSPRAPSIQPVRLGSLSALHALEWNGRQVAPAALRGAGRSRTPGSPAPRLRYRLSLPASVSEPRGWEALGGTRRKADVGSLVVIDGL